MKYRLLGPLEVGLDGSRISINGRKQRALLVALLLNANRVMRIEQLARMLWDEALPATTRGQLHTYIWQLRKLLGGDIIVRRGSGYLLKVEPDELDIQAFEHMIKRGQTALAEGEPAKAAEFLRAALDLWRGAPLADVSAPFVDIEASALEERRMAALEERIQADLALGRHVDLVPELSLLVAQHPFRERLRGQLMVALYRSGRQAEALASYREGRRLLRETLGLEPVSELARLELAILRNEPFLHLATSQPAAATPPSRPAQLPPDIEDFSGRKEHRRRLCALLEPHTGGNSRTSMTVSVISGSAGVGKTTLGIHVAHLLQTAFQDGQLYANLRGTSAAPAEPADVLALFLVALGVHESALPRTLEARTALYRSLVADRGMLILLDDAASESQIRPLLPGSPTCAVIVTARRRLAGVGGARLVDLDVFEPAEAMELLARVVGAEVVKAAEKAAWNILELCGHLPLAVRISAVRIAAQPYIGLSQLAKRLADEDHRLDELEVADLRVRASIHLSYQRLSPEERQALQKLALLNTPDFAAWPVAPYLDVSADHAEIVIGRLVDARLVDVARVDVSGVPRFRLHDLVRVFARERAAEDGRIGDRADQ